MERPMAKPTTKGPNKLLIAVGGLATVFIIVILLKDPVLGMLTQQSDQSDEVASAAPRAKLIPDLLVVSAPLPVQKKVLSAQNVEVVAQVMGIKAAQQSLALATIRNELSELSHQQSIRMIQLGQQQLSFDLARIQAGMVEEELSKVRGNPSTTSVNKTTVMPPQKPKPMLLGVLSDSSAVLWFDSRQTVLTLTQSEGPLTLVSTSQSDKKANVIFYGKPLTLHLSPAPTRPKKVDQADTHIHKEGKVDDAHAG
jgi:hypothetical protein